MTVVLIVLVWGVLFVLRIYTQHGKYYEVPDYTGLTLDQITSRPESAVFDFVVIDSAFDLKRTKGTIIHQDPLPISNVKQNRKIYLTIVSSMPEKTIMPDLKFLTLRQAISTLESCGLKCGKIYYVQTFDEDAVQQQRYQGKVIDPGTRLDKGTSIDLTVGMGSKDRTRQKIPPAAEDSM